MLNGTNGFANCHRVDVDASVVISTTPPAIDSGVRRQILDPQSPSAAAMRRASLILPTGAHFSDSDQFVAAQRKMRDNNVAKHGGQKVLFISHCWRRPQVQETKRKVVSTLALNGWSYWADFLDLKATGPVAWRKEIEDGIRECAKVVLFIDREYLVSFNCLQEVAFAVEFGKPVVVVVLEQEAMDLLTQPTGADDAWTQLKLFEGKLLTPGIGDGMPLTVHRLHEMFEILANINLCMCRETDFTQDSDRVVLQRAHDFVEAELGYQKEHALLQHRALEWERQGRDPSRLLKEAAVVEFEVWIKHALQQGKSPAPTELQQLYVLHSSKRIMTRRRMLQACSVAILLLVAALAIAAGVLWVQAEAAKATAEENAARALLSEQRAKQSAEAARANEAQAVAAEAEAYQEALVATTARWLLHASSDLRRNGFAQAAMREAATPERVSQLPAAVANEVKEQQTRFVRGVERSLVGYPVRRLQVGDVLTGEARGKASMSISPDGRWVVDLFSGRAEGGNLGVYDTESAGSHVLLVPGQPQWVGWQSASDSGEGSFRVVTSHGNGTAELVRVLVPADGEGEPSWASDGHFPSRRETPSPVGGEAARVEAAEAIIARLAWLVEQDPYGVGTWSISPGGREVAVCVVGVFGVVDRVSHEVRALDWQGRCAMAAWARDGQRLGGQFRQPDPHLAVWNLDSLEMAASVQVPRVSRGLRFSLDGAQLLWYSDDRTMSVWNLSQPVAPAGAATNAEVAAFVFEGEPLGNWSIRPPASPAVDPYASLVPAAYPPVGFVMVNNLPAGSGPGTGAYLGPALKGDFVLRLRDLASHDKLVVSFDLLAWGSWDAGEHEYFGLEVDGVPIFRARGVCSTSCNAFDTSGDVVDTSPLIETDVAAGASISGFVLLAGDLGFNCSGCSEFTDQFYRYDVTVPHTGREAEITFRATLNSIGDDESRPCDATLPRGEGIAEACDENLSNEAFGIDNVLVNTRIETEFKVLERPLERNELESLSFTETLIEWSPDGRLVASADEWARMYVHDEQNGQWEALELPERPVALVWGQNSQDLHVVGETGMVLQFRVELPREDEVTRHHARISSLKLSPDGLRVVSASTWDGSVRLWTAAGSDSAPFSLEGVSQILYLEESYDGRPRSADLAPDGQRVAIIDGKGQIYMVSTSDGTTTQFGKHPDSQVQCDTALIPWIIDAAILEYLLVPTEVSVNAYEVAWSPDGKTLVSSMLARKVVQVWDVTSAAQRTIELGLPNYMEVFKSPPAWSPDSKSIVLLTNSFDIRNAPSFVTGTGVLDVELALQIIDIETGTVLALPFHDLVTQFGLKPQVAGVRLSEDFSFDNVGDCLQFDQRFVDVSNVQVADTGMGLAVKYSPDGRRVAAGGLGMVVMWVLSEDGEWDFVYLGTDGVVSSLTWSPDGQHVYTASQLGRVRQWDTGPEAGCRFSRVLEGIQGRMPHMGVGVHALGKPWEEWVVGVTDGRNVRLLSDHRKHHETTQRQGQGVTDEELQTRYGIRDTDAEDEIMCTNR